MSGQQSILRFLKRPLSEHGPKSKVQRTENDLSVAASSDSIAGTSSDDAGDRSEINRSVAELRLKLPSAVKTLIRNMGSEWCFHLASVIRGDSFTKLANFIEQERDKTTIYPPQEEVFTWSKLTPPRRVRVVILGQDPYHGPRQAHGLAFSVRRPQRPPPSLVNIYKEIASDCDASVPDIWPPNHGDLTRWAEQGVLLLNAVLTVRSSQPNSHKGQGWEKLTGAVINYINLHCSHVVFLLWGANAQAQGAGIDRERHLVLHAPHPSPFSVDRGFFGCKHFSKANAYLKDHCLQPIDWTDLS
ncbi:Uracil-DNA glycosylase [Taenia solium]|eukprot:TsM_000732300 transcript=TsM_000732300 gene=TsM_000732300